MTFAVTTPAVYTVTFDGNGHGTTPAAQTVADGDKAAKPADPTAAGWTFGGWFTEAECQNAYDFDTQVTEDRTLYAKWTADSQDSTPESTPDSTSDDSTPDSSSDDTPKGSTADSASNDTAKGNTSDDTSDNTANDNTSDNASRRSSGSTPGGSSNSTSDRTAGSSYVEAPKTGDPNQIWLFAMMLFIGMAGLMSVAVSYGRSRRKEQYAGQDVRDEEGPGQGS